MAKKKQTKRASKRTTKVELTPAQKEEIYQEVRRQKQASIPATRMSESAGFIFRPKGEQPSANIPVKPKASGVSDKDKAALAEARRHSPTAGYDQKLPAAQREIDQIELTYRKKQAARNEMLRRNMGTFGDCLFFPNENC